MKSFQLFLMACAVAGMQLGNDSNIGEIEQRIDLLKPYFGCNVDEHFQNLKKQSDNLHSQHCNAAAPPTNNVFTLIREQTELLQSFLRDNCEHSYSTFKSSIPSCKEIEKVISDISTDLKEISDRTTPEEIEAIQGRIQEALKALKKQSGKLSELYTPGFQNKTEDRKIIKYSPELESSLDLPRGAIASWEEKLESALKNLETGAEKKLDEIKKKNDDGAKKVLQSISESLRAFIDGKEGSQSFNIDDAEAKLIALGKVFDKHTEEVVGEFLGALRHETSPAALESWKKGKDLVSELSFPDNYEGLANFKKAIATEREDKVSEKKALLESYSSSELHKKIYFHGSDQQVTDQFIITQQQYMDDMNEIEKRLSDMNDEAGDLVDEIRALSTTNLDATKKGKLRLTKFDDENRYDKGYREAANKEYVSFENRVNQDLESLKKQKCIELSKDKWTEFVTVNYSAKFDATTAQDAYQELRRIKSEMEDKTKACKGLLEGLTKQYKKDEDEELRKPNRHIVSPWDTIATNIGEAVTTGETLLAGHIQTCDEKIEILMAYSKSVMKNMNNCGNPLQENFTKALKDFIAAATENTDSSKQSGVYTLWQSIIPYFVDKLHRDQENIAYKLFSQIQHNVNFDTTELGPLILDEEKAPENPECLATVDSSFEFKAIGEKEIQETYRLLMNAVHYYNSVVMESQRRAQTYHQQLPVDIETFTEAMEAQQVLDEVDNIVRCLKPLYNSVTDTTCKDHTEMQDNILSAAALPLQRVVDIHAYIRSRDPAFSKIFADYRSQRNQLDKLLRIKTGTQPTKPKSNSSDLPPQ